MFKSTAFLFISFTILTFIGCESGSLAQEKTGEVKTSSNPLIGAWEFVSAKIILPDTVIYVDNTGRIGVYIMSESHYAFVSPTADNKELSYAGKGRYTIEGNSYTEITEFHTVPEIIGLSKKWDFKIEGDMFTKTGTLPVWEEVKPFAGDVSEVQYEEVRRRARVGN